MKLITMATPTKLRTARMHPNSSRPHTKVMDDTDEVQQNMVSNLPLLFANGYPTSLEKITEAQLENFIPFMVQCSLGHINLQGKVDYSEPEWWPEDVSFTIPIVKPKKFGGNWLEKMKEIVIICYQFHKCFFLLKFCNELATYEPARLRFINNYNSTTSLYDRRSNKLLVTFRNENMSYDQPQRNRKCLLLQKSRSQVTEQQQMVEPALFDIYLCDNCDAELYSLEAITEHEKTCTADDDVIICVSPSPTPSPLTVDLSENPNDELRQAFLLNFQLQSLNPSTSPSKAKAIISRNLINNAKEDKEPTKLEKLKRLPRRNRGVYALSRCPTIPLSSPAGQLMIRNTKTVMSVDYLHERLDRMERFCHAPVLTPCIFRPKFLEKKFSALHIPCTFKKPADYHYHTYIPPRRQFSNAHRLEAFMFLNSLLIKACRPISIRVKRLKENDIRRLKRSCNSMRFKHSLGGHKSSDSQIVIDTIDLCSSDEEDVKTPTHSHHIAPDVTLTPLTPLSRDLDKNLEEIRKRSKFEGNFLLSQAISTQPKPLQPSVFLFSNYTTENVHFHRFPSPNNNTPQITEISFQNQENLENSIKKSNEEWSLTPNGRSDRNSKVYHLMSFMDNDVGISKISSPNRTISIDLTS